MGIRRQIMMVLGKGNQLDPESDDEEPSRCALKTRRGDRNTHDFQRQLHVVHRSFQQALLTSSTKDAMAGKTQPIIEDTLGIVNAHDDADPPRPSTATNAT